MTFNLSTVAFLGAVAAVGAVVVGFAGVKPWLYVGGGLMVLGFVTQPSGS